MRISHPCLSPKGCNYVKVTANQKLKRKENISQALPLKFLLVQRKQSKSLIGYSKSESYILKVFAYFFFNKRNSASHATPSDLANVNNGSISGQTALKEGENKAVTAACLSQLNPP